MLQARMQGTLLSLVIAAAMEVGGDAAIRHGLLRSGWPAIVVGAALLVGYGLVVNTSLAVDFGRLMGVYIVVFFVVSQLIGMCVLGEWPSRTLLLGGALIITGGGVIQLGVR